MRSIWNTNYSPPPPQQQQQKQPTPAIESTPTPTTNTKLNIERPSPQLPSTRQMSPLHLLQFPTGENTARYNQTQPREIMMKEHHHTMYPPALDPNWPGSRYDATSFEHDMIKRRRLSASTSTDHQIIKKVMNRNNPNNSHHHVSTSTTLLTNNSPATTDTYYHQSRRKKRDTKPPNANDIRPFVEVEKKDGDYVLPAEVDSWTVLSLGSVVWDRAAFHNQRYIYPVGYRVKK